MMTRLGAFLLTCIAMAAVSPGSAVAQGEILERGNQLYQEGDYPGAVDAYEIVLASGHESADLHYNLGNAYFKAGQLGRSILAWERAFERAPGDPDIRANLDLARSLTADAVEPLPRFWLISAVSWWFRLVPRGLLIVLVSTAWLALTLGVTTRILTRSESARGVGGWLAAGGLGVLLVFGTSLVVQEFRIGQPDRGVILAQTVAVRSAPAADDDLTLFEVHEGTIVRIDQRTGEWSEVVLEDGKVGWVPADVIGVI